MRNILNQITYKYDDSNDQWRKIPFNDLATTPNFNRGTALLSVPPAMYDTGNEYFILPRTGLWNMKVQLFFTQDHMNKQPLLDNNNWNFTGLMALRLVVRDSGGNDYELCRHHYMHSQYVIIDGFSCQDMCFLPAGTRVWCELIVKFPQFKDGQVVIPKTDSTYASHFKIAFIH